MTMAILDNDGDVTYVQGSGSKPYELKNVEGVLSCSCPAWRNQGLAIDKRTCKHLKKVRGDAAEAARVGGVPAPAQPAPTAPAVTSPGAQAIVARAAAQGRKLRPDEKAKLYGPPVLLAHSFEDYKDLDPTGWWYSEKLDGVRAYWNGKDFVSREGNVFHAPDWFKAPLPKGVVLDGELWMGRRMFQKTLSVVRRHNWGDLAKRVRYVIFDVPEHGGIFEARLNEAFNHTIAANVPHFVAHPHDLVKSRDHLMAELAKIEALGGEGLMIRKPGSLYEVGRSDTLLKAKPFKDAEAEVVGHVPGKGKHKGVLGGLEVRMPDGKTFNVGTGLTDADRRNPPKIGATITYRYTELTDRGIPKCASFVATRDYE